VLTIGSTQIKYLLVWHVKEHLKEHLLKVWQTHAHVGDLSKKHVNEDITIP
jgi:hypothetical protein